MSEPTPPEVRLETQGAVPQEEAERALARYLVACWIERRQRGSE